MAPLGEPRAYLVSMVTLARLDGRDLGGVVNGMRLEGT
jgi:hypothetical protein